MEVASYNIHAQHAPCIYFAVLLQLLLCVDHAAHSPNVLLVTIITWVTLYL